MKQWLKNFALAGATAAAAVLGAASASAVSFTVVIDKIELMENNNSVERFVVYHPAAGIGGTATTTLDLLNANKSGASLPIAAPRAGTYRTMLVTFSDIRVSASTATVSATQQLNAALGVAQGFGNELGRKVLVMGDVAAGTGIGQLLGGVQPAVPMQPAVSNGVTVTLPAVNFFLPASSVAVSNNNTVNVTRLPVPLAVARNDVDAAGVPNVTLGVKPRAFREVTTAQGGTTGSNFNVRVGLFRSALDLKPVYMLTATLPSATTVGAESVTEVTFVDVADGTYLPLAWIDRNNNGLLDSGEATVMATAGTAVATTDNNLTGGADHQRFLTINKSDLFGANATTTGVVSTTSAAFNTSATTTGGGTTNVNTGAPLGATGNNPTGMLGHSQGFFLFPAREISISIAVADAASATINYGNDAFECDAACGMQVTWAGGQRANATADATLTFSVGTAAASITTPSLTVRFDKDGTTTAGGANIENGNLARLTMAAATAQAASSSVLSYSATGLTGLAGSANTEAAVLTISPVPVTGIVNMNVNTDAPGYATYSVGYAIQGRHSGGTTVGAIDVGTISQADVALDADAGAGHFNNTLQRVRVIGGNRKVLTTSLGD